MEYLFSVAALMISATACFIAIINYRRVGLWKNTDDAKELNLRIAGVERLAVETPREQAKQLEDKLDREIDALVTRMSEGDGETRNAIQVVSSKLREVSEHQGNQIAQITENLRHVPTHQDIAELNKAVGALTAEQAATGAEVRGITVPDTRVGRRGRPNVVEFGGSEASAFTLDYGLEDEIPQDDIDQANSARALNPDLATPQAHATELVTDLIVLDREVRTADLVFNPASYDANGKVQLAGAAQWSDPASDPAKVIQDALDAMIMRANVLTLGQPTWTALRRHPKIVKAINRNEGDQGMVTRQQLADYLELEEVLVGRAWVNTAKPGQAEQFRRAWGKHASLTRRNKLADRKRGVTFGYTVPYGTRLAWEKPDSDIGLRGGVRVRVGESVRELITCPDAGYFFQNAVA